ncbi:hypothetical protein NP493_868g01001 [Ridgeia piscesae]|uniref:G-protein coupled receptors family 1 profile domain-containing protein n=1 Tax=Ridgeia piscesae TaxID=27915 RepID=A0AAD9KLU2_RIDPI|nr:hypothetical protein NP493_868g01001 [Ridgeia piscesae]
MTQCVEFPVRSTDNFVSYVTTFLVTPILFGFGILGNLLIIVVLNRRYLRKENPVYVYLTALATVDLLALGCKTLSAVRQTESLGLETTYSWSLTVADTVSSAAGDVFRHAATWLLAVGLVAAYVVQARDGKRPTPRWTRISASRIVVFVLVVFAAIVDMPGFFELQVVEVKGHCFSEMTLWTHNYSSLGGATMQLRAFDSVYPSVVSGLNVVLPFFVLLVFTLVVFLLHYGGVNVAGRKVALRTPRDEEERQFQVHASLVLAAFLFLLLRLPDAVLQMVAGSYSPAVRNGSVFRSVSLLAGCLYVASLSAQFVIYIVFNADFRKTFRRTFCYACNTHDAYFESPLCCSQCCCCGGDQRQPSLDAKAETMKNGKASAIPTEQLLWV